MNARLSELSLVRDVLKCDGGGAHLAVGPTYRHFLGLVAGLVSYATPGSPLSGVPISVFSDRLDARTYWSGRCVGGLRAINELGGWVGKACQRVGAPGVGGVVLIDAVGPDGAFAVWNAVRHARHGRYTVVVGVPNMGCLGGETLLRLDTCVFDADYIMGDEALCERILSVMGARTKPSTFHASVQTRLSEPGLSWLAVRRNEDAVVFALV